MASPLAKNVFVEISSLVAYHMQSSLASTPVSMHTLRVCTTRVYVLESTNQIMYVYYS